MPKKELHFNLQLTVKSVRGISRDRALLGILQMEIKANEVGDPRFHLTSIEEDKTEEIAINAIGAALAQAQEEQMGKPRTIASIAEAIKECQSVASSLDMPARYREDFNPDIELDTLVNTDHWVHHAVEHLNEVVNFLYGIQRLPLTPFYFTFSLSDPFHSTHFVRVLALNYLTARLMMIRKFSTKWAFQYTEDEWHSKETPQDVTYGYTEINLDDFDNLGEDEDV